MICFAEAKHVPANSHDDKANTMDAAAYEDSDEIPPKYCHGDLVNYKGSYGVVERRRHDGSGWQYGLLMPGFAALVWIGCLVEESAGS